MTFPRTYFVTIDVPEMKVCLYASKQGDIDTHEIRSNKNKQGELHENRSQEPG